MKFEVASCETRGYGACAVDTQGVAGARELTGSMRLARVAAGTAFLGAAAVMFRLKPLRPLAAIGGWFGISHLVAAATAFSGCPELGAIPSLILGRDVHTVCGPWDRIDAKLTR